jgi:hypothetical protein
MVGVTQRKRIERMLIDRGSRGAHSFEFYADGMPRAAVVVSRLKRAGWDISAVPEVSPSGGQGVRYVLRSLPSERSSDSDSEPGGEHAHDDEQLALLPPVGPRSAVYGDA